MDREVRREVRSLEREPQRKEQALAETAALLTLSKKARALWGEGEDACSAPRSASALYR